LKWKHINTKTVLENSHWSYCIDDFSIGENYKSEYHYVHTNGSSLIIPVLENNKLLMVEQYRYLNRKASLEFPCGSIEKGLSPIENAQKELREETGFFSNEMSLIGEFSPYTGASDEICSVFIGKNLTKQPLPKDPTEIDIKVIELSVNEIEKLMNENKIWDGLTLAAWTLSKNFIKQIQ